MRLSPVLIVSPCSFCSHTSFVNLVLFLTVTLGMSALPVLARILSERRMLTTRLGEWYPPIAPLAAGVCISATIL